MSEITEKERDAFISKCIDDGMSLSEIQKALVAQFDLHLTYMELRLIAADLQVSWDKQDAKAEAAHPHTQPTPKAAAHAQPQQHGMRDEAAAPEVDAYADDAMDADTDFPPEDDATAADDDAAPASKTTVEISQIVRPGTSLSGKVHFGSGASGEWYVDGMGRLGFEPDEGSSKPNDQDIREFQVELRRALGY